MATFIGDFICKIDSKGRFLLPAAFKKQMTVSDDNRFVIKKDIYEKCLLVYPISEWEKQVEFIRSKVNSYNREHNKFLRDFFKGSAEITLDSNNRLLIPKRLAELIDIKTELNCIGVDTKIEIWAKEIYESISDNTEDLANLAEKILGNTFSESTN